MEGSSYGEAQKRGGSRRQAARCAAHPLLLEVCLERLQRGLGALQVHGVRDTLRAGVHCCEPRGGMAASWGQPTRAALTASVASAGNEGVSEVMKDAPAAGSRTLTRVISSPFPNKSLAAHVTVSLDTGESSTAMTYLRW
jgi:hypothetical protein